MLCDVGRGGPLVKQILAEEPPVTAPNDIGSSADEINHAISRRYSDPLLSVRPSANKRAKFCTPVLSGETGAPVADGFSGQRASIRSRGVFLFSPLRLRPGQHPINSKVPESNLRGLKDMGKGSRVLWVVILTLSGMNTRERWGKKSPNENGNAWGRRTEIARYTGCVCGNRRYNGTHLAGCLFRMRALFSIRNAGKMSHGPELSQKLHDKLGSARGGL